MGVSVGTVTEDQASDFLATMGHAFGFDSEEDDVSRFSDVFEWDRARAAYDGERIVGTIGSFSLDMTVPGGTMACGGTTVVSVLPTHRRKGILRMMMDSHLDDVRDREEPIAGLWASESSIYGRFGYGLAAQAAEVTVDRAHTAFHRLAPAPAPVRLISRDDALDLLPPFYDEARKRFPGFLGRSSVWWEKRRLQDRRRNRDGATAYRFAVTEENSVVTGFVQYRYKEDWSEGHGNGTVRIVEMLGSTPEAWSGLWGFALNHDLTSKIIAPNRSPDDPIFGLLAAPRRAHTTVDDSLWIRIIDVARALEGRSYASAASAVIRVHDPLDASTSSWQLHLTPDSAQVTTTAETPQIEMDIEDLGACFMGRSRFQDLARAGRLTGEAEALTALDGAFAWSPAPWCPEVF
ncbi:MAG TPA: GNAT family N-acetyltransferase [Acidimicrobiia bacterium]|nr:GNAT family N-acetyltransferase [Acidimicrobiia bacterium]